jgi:hypothetical protein
MFSDKLIPLEFTETILLLQKLVPATFSQTRDIDQINPLIKRAIKLKEKDAIYFQKNPIKEEPEEKEKPKEKIIPSESKNSKEFETNYTMLLGGAVLSVFIVSLGYYFSKKPKN